MKIIIKVKFLSVFFFLFTLCVFTSSCSDEIDKQNTIIYKIVIKTMQDKYNISCDGTGISCFQNELKYLAFRFHSNEKCSMEQARKMLLDCASIYLTNINSNEILKKHMVKHPFDDENCNIIISFSDQNHKEYFLPYITSIMYHPKGILFYGSNESSYFELIKCESFEEARKNNAKYLESIQCP